MVTTVLFTATLEAVEATEEASTSVSAVVEANAEDPAACACAVEVLSEHDELISVTSMAKETCATVEAAAPEAADAVEATATVKEESTYIVRPTFFQSRNTIHSHLYCARLL